MSVVSVEARSFILALFIRDDGERFLLGDNGYDFMDSQLHFVANTIENDEVEKQGIDGTMLAGQVRRSSVQSFDGYVGDARMPKQKIEELRRAFIAFFAKGHHFRVVYVDCNRQACQRKGGYLVDAPEVKELWQIHPEYHVGLNFEDVNYYEYDENAEGEEILANILSVPISSEIEGGLEWDNNGAISDLPFGEVKTASGNPISIADAVEAPLKSLEIQGNTTQQTYTGKNKLKMTGATATGVAGSVNADGSYTISGKATSGSAGVIFNQAATVPAGTYTFTISQALPVVINLTFGSGLGFRLEPGQTSFTRTLPNDVTSGGQIYFAMQNGVTYDITLNWQLTAGSSADTDFEPYVGGIPAPNPDYPQAVQTVTGENVVTISDGQGNEQSYEVNLGKNLFDIDKYSDAYLRGSGAGVSLTKLSDNTLRTTNEVAQSFNFCGIPIQNSVMLLGKTVSISLSVSLQGVSITRAMLAWDTGGVGSVIGTPTDISASGNYNLSVSVPDSMPSGARGILLVIYANGAQTSPANSYVDWSNIQIELGSTATSYAAYFEPIELCKIGDYQDYIYKSGDKWYVHKECGKHLLDGSENWWESGAQTDNVYQVATGGYAGVPVSAGYSDSLEIITTTAWYAERLPNKAVFTSNNIYVRVSQSLASSLEQFKAWLASNTPTLYAVLATPTDTEITDAALIAQLEAILAGGTQAGANTIVLTPSAGATGTLEVEYYSEYQDGGYVWEEGGSGGPTVVMNESISEVYPVWTVYGPAQNPILENTTNGDEIEFVGLVADGQTLIVDMGAQTAFLDGLNVISSLAGEFIALEAGQNTLLYSASNDAPNSEIGWSEIVG